MRGRGRQHGVPQEATRDRRWLPHSWAVGGCPGPLPSLHDRNLKRIVAACKDQPVFIVSPIFRFTLSPCCATNFQDPDFIKTLLKDRGRIRNLLKSNFSGNTIIDRMELVCGQGYNLEKAEAAARSAWVSDPVHPSNHSFAKMVLNLLEAMAPAGILSSQGGSSGRKR